MKAIEIKIMYFAQFVENNISKNGMGALVEGIHIDGDKIERINRSFRF